MFIENKYSRCYYSIVAHAKSRNLKGYKENPDSFVGRTFTEEEKKAQSKEKKEAANKHTIAHPIFGEFVGSLALLSDTYPDQQLRKDELWRLTIGYNKSYKGWRMVSAIVSKTPRKKTNRSSGQSD